MNYTVGFRRLFLVMSHHHDGASVGTVQLMQESHHLGTHA